MIDTIIVSGGNIHSDFALDFLQKNKKDRNPQPSKVCDFYPSSKTIL